MKAHPSRPGERLQAGTPRREREAEARAAVAVFALSEAHHADDVREKRRRLELARIQLRKSLQRLEADLQKIPA